jgi:predicted kinase
VEAVIFIGLQGAGKSTIYEARFAASHVRVSLDLLKTRHRERELVRACLAARRAFVVDNTNPACADREGYILAAKEAGYRVAGYYFQSRIDDCQRRNCQREAARQVPLIGLLGTARRLELPQFSEGFDELHYVRIEAGGRFLVEDWLDEV